jgi:hypothetical protein
MIEITTSRVCIVQFYADVKCYDDDVVTIAQGRRLDVVNDLQPRIAFINPDSYQKDVNNYLVQLKDYFDDDLHEHIRIIISSPNTNGSGCGIDDLPQLHMYNQQYINLTDI